MNKKNKDKLSKGAKKLTYKKKKKKQRHTDKPIKIDRTSHGQKIK